MVILRRLSLHQELEFLRNYVDIEQTRFRDRLTVTFDVEPQVLDARVPNLVLQPLVENAIRHGVAPRAEPGHIAITARRINGDLELRVRDDGPGLSGAPGTRGGGVGVANTRERLQRLYGGGHAFEMQNAPDGGVEVRVVIPYTTTAVADGVPDDGASG